MPLTTKVPVTIRDSEGVLWNAHIEERREAVLSIDRSNNQVARPQYLVFVSEFGQRRRSKEPVADGWEGLPQNVLRDLLKSGVGMRDVGK